MNEGLEILKNKIQNLPEPLKSYVKSSGWTENLKHILADFNFEEWQENAIENETLLVLVGLQPYTNLPQNMSKEADLDFKTSQILTERIIKSILAPISEDTLEEMKKNGDINLSLLNQMKAMQPAREEGGTSYELRVTRYEERDMDKKDRIPENLPTEKGRDRPKMKVPSYGGADPYREPVE